MLKYLTPIIMNVIAVLLLFFSLVKDRKKARQALIAALRTGLRILPMILFIIILVGLLLGFVPPEIILRYAGDQSGLVGGAVAALAGAVLHVPAIISFPLAGSLLESGASVAVVAVFITTLTMIGTVTLPMEIRELGKKVALLRNGFSFIVAIVIGFLMGLIL